MQKIRHDVEDHSRPINNVVDFITEIVETGADVLSSAELSQLQREGKMLKERYNHVDSSSEKLFKCMLSALDELAKFQAETSTFTNWMEKAFRTLEDKEKEMAKLDHLRENGDGIQSFVADVMTHGADLKFLSISAQKFLNSLQVPVTFFLMALRIIIQPEL